MTADGYRLLRWLLVALLAAAVAWLLFSWSAAPPPEPAAIDDKPLQEPL
jgi:hypothetical protein